MSQPLTLDWYEISTPSPGVFALLEPLQVERVLSYLIVGSERALLIDTGTGAVSMKAAVETLTDLPVLARQQPFALGSRREQRRVRRDRDPSRRSARAGAYLQPDGYRAIFRRGRIARSVT